MGLADACLHVCMEGFASLGATLCGDSSGRRGLSNVADTGLAIAGQRWRSPQGCWREIGWEPPERKRQRLESVAVPNSSVSRLKELYENPCSQALRKRRCFPACLTMNYFVSRHPGALEWMRRQVPGSTALEIAHLDTDCGLGSGDRVFGVLPLVWIEHIHRAGAEAWVLEVELPPSLRGQELSAETLDALGARLVRYRVERGGEWASSLL